MSWWLPRLIEAHVAADVAVADTACMRALCLCAALAGCGGSRATPVPTPPPGEVSPSALRDTVSMLVRTLGVRARANGIYLRSDIAYATADAMSFDGIYRRSDIALREARGRDIGT